MKTTPFKFLFVIAFLFLAKDAKLQIITTVAGNGVVGYSGDGDLGLNAAIGRVTDVDIAASGNMYITSDANSVIRKVNAITGIITTVAGNGISGYGGDGGLAINAQLNHPTSSAIDSLGNIYISDTRNYRIRKVNVTTGIITTIAGTGVWGGSGDGGLAINALLGEPLGIALNASGTILYIADGVNQRIRQVNLITGIISATAGTGVRGYNGDGIPAINAYLNGPSAVTVDASGNIYFFDGNNYRIREIYASNGIITTIGGNGIQGYSGDLGLATNAKIGYGYGISIDKKGSVFFSQVDSHVVREIHTEDSIISTVAGNGSSWYYGDGDYATNAALNYPYGLSTDSRGNFYIADHENFRIRKVIVDSILLNEIFGYAYYDLNSNNLKDSGEQLFGQGEIIVNKNSDSIVGITQRGDFRIGVDTGSYLSSFTPFKDYYKAVPQSHTSNFSGYNNIDTVYFSLQPIAGKRDLHISMFALRPTRPGFETNYEIQYQNIGTDTIPTGEIQLIKDSRLDIISSTPPYSSMNGDTIKWNYNNLKTFDDSTIIIAFSLPVNNANIGDTLHSIAFINPVNGDITPMDDTSSISQIVVGSFDPNDKSENHAGSISKKDVKRGDWLTYAIRFQNTGTDTAFNIIVRDTLSDKLDWSTLQMVDASHNYQLNINNGSRCAWYFNNVLLPDSNVNEQASHGYIVYRIKPKTTLLNGDIINNTASIYFDYNLPVETNTESTIVKNIVLPLQIISFTATRNFNSNVLLWKTAQEVNTSYFEIQRSGDGINFSATGRINAAGNTQSNYSFTDQHPLNGIDYYRLKITDGDGKYTYSKIIQVNNTTVTSMVIKPNPSTNGKFLLDLGAIKNNIIVRITDNNGREVYTQQLSLAQNITINLSKPKGIYHLQVFYDGGRGTQKVVVE